MHDDMLGEASVGTIQHQIQKELKLPQNLSLLIK